MQTVLMSPDGTEKEIAPKDGRKFNFRELQQIIGGYFEFVPVLNPDFLLVVDEDGLSKDLEPNQTASLHTGRKIVGAALYCRRDQLN